MKPRQHQPKSAGPRPRLTIEERIEIQACRCTARDSLDNVAAELNGRPRETLNWRTPAEALEELLLNPPSSCIDPLKSPRTLAP